MKLPFTPKPSDWSECEFVWNYLWPHMRPTQGAKEKT